MFRTTDANGKVKYIGTSKATVLDNRDPENKGRIRVEHTLLGETSWIDYLKVPGTFAVPMIGEIVYIQCDSGEPEYAYAWGNLVVTENGQPLIPQEFQRTVPTNKGIFSPAGHFIELDDGKAVENADPSYDNLSTKGRGIRITSSTGHSIFLEDDTENLTNRITIEDNAGSRIVLDSRNKELTIFSQGKTYITSTDDINVRAVDSQESHTVKNFVVAASDTFQAVSNNALLKGNSQTTVGSTASPTKVDGQTVAVAGGGTGIARVGDRAIGVGNLGFPVTSTIIQGSTKANSG